MKRTDKKQTEYKMGSNKKTAIVTGAGGTLGSAIALDFGRKGMNVVLIGRTVEKLQVVEKQIKEIGGEAISIAASASNLEEMETARNTIMEVFGSCDILINAAGGNQIEAVTTVNEFQENELENDNSDFRGFFNLKMDKFRSVIEDNSLGTVIPSQVFGKEMAKNKKGSIINFASMTSYRPLSRVPAYAMVKAGIANFTQWLAAYLAPANIRVNAVAPGFFLNDRSKKRLMTPDGGYSPRGQKIIDHTPMKRFGEAEELLGCVNWLIDDKASGFVTGITVPVDGGFLSDAGV
ncbi:SDR family oxidoreductase [Flexithrix dorotheae]|uniref:SDR family oxidoreductase n=1 Tax=Flexithrix dorotheae TaxID=70993 RepID=UPI00037510C5|nr:SDR family oxidoreductase [Flexithrix dorotheae]